MYRNNQIDLLEQQLSEIPKLHRPLPIQDLDVLIQQLERHRLLERDPPTRSIREEKSKIDVEDRARLPTDQDIFVMSVLDLKDVGEYRICSQAFAEHFPGLLGPLFPKKIFVKILQGVDVLVLLFENLLDLDELLL